MFARAASGSVLGVDAQPVIVESHRANGLPGLAVIGLARGAVKESAVRVRSAIVATGVSLGSHKLVVNLLPAELPKEASALDLPFAVSLLASGGALPAACLSGRRFFGELSLGGGVEPVRGAVLIADLARRMGDTELVVPAANAAEAAVIPGVRVVGVTHLGELMAHLKGEQALTPAEPPSFSQALPPSLCLGEVHGQARPKRALELAAAGGHNLLMIGPPGSGKTMLARRMPGLLPPLEPDASIEVTRIYSAAGLLRRDGLVTHPPFRAPHHTASEVALCGGSGVPRPGEITLAHQGVLFLDELPEFSRRALESLREPLEEGSIHIARAAMSLTFPASVLLIAAMNPCPCGYHGSDPKASGRRVCLCSYEQVQRYRARISGPLLDRIDMHVGVEAVPFADFARKTTQPKSIAVRQKIVRARQRQSERLGTGRTNARMRGHEVAKHVALQDRAYRSIEAAVERHGLSTRAIGRVLKLARTIADVADCDSVRVEHLEEAINFRILDRSP